MPGSVAIVVLLRRTFITYSALCWLPSGTIPQGIANYMLIESSRAPNYVLPANSHEKLKLRLIRVDWASKIDHNVVSRQRAGD